MGSARGPRTQGSDVGHQFASRRLAGDGVECGALTNRQIADRLYLSPHTVDTHLPHAFAKLGIRSRVELARLVPE